MNIVSDDVYNKSRKQYEKERFGDIGKNFFLSEINILNRRRT